MSREEKINFLLEHGWEMVYSDENWTYKGHNLINYNGYSLEWAFSKQMRYPLFMSKLLDLSNQYNKNEEFMSKTQTFREYISSMFTYEELLDEISNINDLRKYILKNLNELNL